MAVGDRRSIQREQDLALNQSNIYRQALERAAYGDAGSQFGQGLGQITNYLARSGPLADSGAATALRYRLASQIYGGARNRINSGYADFLGQRLNQAAQFRYQQMLAKMQRDQQKTGVGGVLGGVVGGLAGPFLGAVGASYGNKVSGGY